MKILKKIFSWTLTHKILMSAYWCFQYLKDWSYVSESLHSEAFMLVLRRYLNADFKSDWIGRVYGVINPSINIDGSFNMNNTIIEIDGSNTNSNEYVKSWITKQLLLVRDVYNLNSSGFFDYIGMSIKHVGPKKHDNYLVVFDIVSRKEFADFFKSAIIHATIYSFAILGVYLILM